MIRIITSSQYNAIVDIVTDLQKENEELKAKLAKKDESLTYVNDKLFERTKEVSRLRKKLNDHGITWSITGVDFPATSKIPDPIQDINQILGH